MSVCSRFFNFCMSENENNTKQCGFLFGVTGRFTALLKLMDVESFLTVAIARLVFELIIAVERKEFSYGNLFSSSIAEL